MFHKTKLKTFIIILILCLPVMACGGNDSAESSEVITTEPATSDESSTSSDTTISSEPAQTHGTPVTEIDQIVGTWIAFANPEIFYLMIDFDGTVLLAPSLSDLEDGSTNSWVFKMEEDKILADDYALCPGEVGSYFGVINEDGTLKLNSLFEPCPSRLRHLDHSLPGRLFEYNLVYSPVQ